MEVIKTVFNRSLLRNLKETFHWDKVEFPWDSAGAGIEVSMRLLSVALGLEVDS